nr:uncharacterized protein LOC103455109 [Malus domestica]
MGSRIVPCSKSWQSSLQISAPISSSFSKGLSFSVSFPSVTKPSGRSNGALGCGFVRWLNSSGSGNSKRQRTSNQGTGFLGVENFKNLSDFDVPRRPKQQRQRLFYAVFKLEAQCIGTLSAGDSSGAAGLAGEKRNSQGHHGKKGHSLEFPVSLRLIKKKQRQQREEGPKREAGEFTFCSLNKAFSSMVFIIRELHSHALSIRESLYSEDLQEVIAKVQKREMNMSFVWLFQQVFSGSPTLMVYVMILLANFSVYSMNCNAVVAPPLPVLIETLTETETEEQPYSKPDYVSDDDSTRVVKKTSNEGDFRDNASTETSFRHAIVDIEKMYGISLFNGEEFTAEEEVKLWNSVMEEASRMQSEARDEALDHETVQKFVSPITVNVEPDYHEHYFRTDLLYQMGLAQDPHNALLLSNYAHFLHVVARDHDRAEECFRRAVQGEKPDAEALSRYADFLWLVRKDMWGAEERYQQAMAEEPDNPFYASKYANFLWSTGAEDTCFPLSTSYDNYNKVL